MLTAEEKIRIIELRASGHSIEKIAKQGKVSKQTVVDVIRDGREKVAALEAIQLETLYEAQRITLTERIRNIASVYRKIQEEIEKRDLSEVPTEKLVDMYLKTSAQLSGAIVEPNFLSSSELEEARGDREALEKLSRR